MLYGKVVLKELLLAPSEGILKWMTLQRSMDGDPTHPLFITICCDQVISEEMVKKVKRLNGESEGVVIEGAWHNHSIDVPERFARVVNGWVGKMFAVSE